MTSHASVTVSRLASSTSFTCKIHLRAGFYKVFFHRKHTPLLCPSIAQSSAKLDFMVTFDAPVPRMPLPR